MNTAFPAIIAFLLVSPFVRLFTVLSFLGWGLGLRRGGLGIVIAALAFSLSLVIAEPQLRQIGGWEAILSGNVQPTAIETAFRPILEKQTKPEMLERFSSVIPKVQGEETSAGVATSRIAAFLVSELSEAFKLAVTLLIALLVIDLLVTNVLMLLGVTQLPTEAVSLPLKILVFVVVDGWGLLTSKLLAAYG